MPASPRWQKQRIWQMFLSYVAVCMLLMNIWARSCSLTLCLTLTWLTTKCRSVGVSVDQSSLSPFSFFTSTFLAKRRENPEGNHDAMTMTVGIACLAPEPLRQQAQSSAAASILDLGVAAYLLPHPAGARRYQGHVVLQRSIAHDSAAAILPRWRQ